MTKVTSKDGTTIAYEKSGQGSAVILVDGALCYRAFGPMAPLAKLLESHFTVYIYDRRGRGESSDTKPYILEREIEDIEALVAEAGGSAFVYGASSGGALALRATAQLSGIKKLAMYEAPFNGSEKGLQVARDYTKDLTELLAADRRGDAVERFMTMVGTPAEMVAGMKHSPVWAGFEAIALTLAYDNAAIGDGSVPTDQAAKVKVPTLIMAGGASPAFMRDSAKLIAKEVASDAEHRILEGQVHNIPAEVIAPELVEFFTRRE
jgi:pimeloyl-ACP methyl ester carboxylesterase